jgi:hypothetical protein
MVKSLVKEKKCSIYAVCKELSEEVRELEL